MPERFITLNNQNIGGEHICCAFSDKKCAHGYALKKEWLSREFGNGYVFRRLDEKAKVFMEYGPAEKAWAPIEASGYFFINCFWVSGRYKGKGHAKALLQAAIDDAVVQGKNGLVTVAGKKKFHFMSDGKWLLGQGFSVCGETPDGFELLVHKINKDASDPLFRDNALAGGCPEKEGLVAYYSNRCPYTELHVTQSLSEAAGKREMPLKVIKLETMEQAQAAPVPATVFSLFYNGRFVTTDVSSCMDSRFDKALGLK